MVSPGRGQRIARARRRRGLSQAALAGLVGRSESWLSQVERGLRQVDSHSVLLSLAEVLRVDVAELTGDEQAEQQASQYTAALDIERAMMVYDGLESVIGGDEAGRTPDIKRLALGLGRPGEPGLPSGPVRRSRADAACSDPGRRNGRQDLPARRCDHGQPVAVPGLSGDRDGTVPGREDRAGVDRRRPSGDSGRTFRSRYPGGDVRLPTGARVHPPQANHASPRPGHRRSQRSEPFGRAQ